MMVLLGIAAMIGGVYVRRNPEAGWRMNEGWKVRGDSEPSRAYIESRKFTGLMAVAAGALFAVLGIVVILRAINT
ncbi:hypothetical protein C2I18_08710 [Paenibacillus sp. PK3_47]|nr:hypothetical protein C2I18_08710 [Paenibacillus sp. PK3_47]